MLTGHDYACFWQRLRTSVKTMQSATATKWERQMCGKCVQHRWSCPVAWFSSNSQGGYAELCSVLLSWCMRHTGLFLVFPWNCSKSTVYLKNPRILNIWGLLGTSGAWIMKNPNEDCSTFGVSCATRHRSKKWRKPRPPLLHMCFQATLVALCAVNQQHYCLVVSVEYSSCAMTTCDSHVAQISNMDALRNFEC